MDHPIRIADLPDLAVPPAPYGAHASAIQLSGSSIFEVIVATFTNGMSPRS